MSGPIRVKRRWRPVGYRRPGLTPDQLITYLGGIGIRLTRVESYEENGECWMRIFFNTYGGTERKFADTARGWTNSVRLFAKEGQR